MGQVLDEAEMAQMSKMLMEAHISETENVSISLAQKKTGEFVSILTFTSCCGITNYEIPIEDLKELRIGIDGAFACMEAQQNAPRH